MISRKMTLLYLHRLGSEQNKSSPVNRTGGAGDERLDAAQP